MTNYELQQQVRAYTNPRTLRTLAKGKPIGGRPRAHLDPQLHHRIVDVAMDGPITATDLATVVERPCCVIKGAVEHLVRIGWLTSGTRPKVRQKRLVTVYSAARTRSAARG